MSRKRALRIGILAAVLVLGSPPARGQTPGQERFLVLPFGSIGVSDTTVAVVHELLSGDLERRGVALAAPPPREDDPLSGLDPCVRADCARERALRSGSDGVVYGSLSRLGGKVIVQVRALRLADQEPFYQDRLSAASEEDLDRVVVRIAEAIAGGRPDSREATVESVIHEETRKPLLRSSRKGLGIRAGFLLPFGDSYGEVERLTSVRIPFKYETSTYFLETTTLAGLDFGRSFDAVDWTIFDLFAARVFGLGDRAAHVGAGLGIHSVRVEMEQALHDDPPYSYPYSTTKSQSATTLTADAGVGLLLLRTYDFQVVLDLRYHYVLEDFEKVNDKGAHGVRLSFGTHR